MPIRKGLLNYEVRCKHICPSGLNRGWVPNPVGTLLLILISIVPPTTGFLPLMYILYVKYYGYILIVIRNRNKMTVSKSKKKSKKKSHLPEIRTTDPEY